MRTVYYRPNRPKSLAHDIIFPPTSTSCIELELVLCDFVNVDSSVDLVAVNEVSVVMLVVVIQ